MAGGSGLAFQASSSVNAGESGIVNLEVDNAGKNDGENKEQPGDSEDAIDKNASAANNDQSDGNSMSHQQQQMWENSFDNRDQGIPYANVSGHMNGSAPPLVDTFLIA